MSILRMSHQHFNVVLLLYTLQLLLDLLRLFLQLWQTVPQLPVCEGQGLVAPDDGHDRRFRPAIEVS